jgi:hypothetical protein
VRVHLPRLGLSEFCDIPVDEFEQLAAIDRFGEHELTESPEESDVILFSQPHMLMDDWRLRAIREHPLTQRYPERVLVYDERDVPWCAFPGVYVSMPARSFDAGDQRAWAYFRFREVVADARRPDLLFSFIGSPSHRCRRPLFQLRHRDAVVERVRGFVHYDPGSEQFAARVARFDEILNRSRFVLCPRGQGTSSFRLYQALSLGRVPVVVADDWVPPEGVDWSSFCIRWPESAARSLPAMLEERDADWETMSAAALVAYRTWFAPDVGFHRVVEQCRELQASGRPAALPYRGRHDRAFLVAGAVYARWRYVRPLRVLAGRLLRRVGLRR